ncbi:dihydrofolate reductase family protein [Nocardia sp. NPDC088792]|uniref:dihydrofolate reductase family protein n=1 Tax=Nocardia sp. NPDC088792 TaxID=3364332 RepID=UPI00381F054C
MRKLAYFVAVSLDGYIAGPNGEYDFYPESDDKTAWVNERFPETVPTHIRAHVGMPVDTPDREWDTVLMGRGAYEPARAAGIVSPYEHMKQYVFSSTLDPVDDPQVEIVGADPVEFVRKLKAEAGLGIWLCGGGRLAGALIDEIDELVIKSYPVIAGAGVPMIAGGFRPARFDVTDRREFGNGTIVTRLTRAGGGS